MSERTVVVYAAVLALVAALVHFVAIPEHFEEWWGHGILLLATATAQGLYGVVLLRAFGSPVFLLCGLVGNLAIILLYVVTRTLGIPFFGPHAGEVEDVGVLDMVATLAEVGLVTLLAALWRSGRRSLPLTLLRGAEVISPSAVTSPSTGTVTSEDGSGVSRRDFLRAAGVMGALGVSGGIVGARAAQGQGHRAKGHGSVQRAEAAHGGLGTKGDVDISRFDPMKFLRNFYWGEEHKEGGKTVREYELVAEDVQIEVAPGVMYPAWAYNGQVPGPTLRAREGDRLRIVFKNRGAHPHTIHFHGFHPANMDGVFELVGPGQQFVYEFDAEPFGCHLYHCHVMPLKKHIEKGLYGAFIVDPKEGRPEADEMVMVMNGFDTNFDRANEVYAVNTVAFHYQKHPIQIKQGELIRAYVVNALEFDLINSIHLHANFFDYYPTGTKLVPSEFTDTKVFAQGERGILEFRYDRPGRFTFHAHVSEFAELGWMSLFDVKE
jgi:FtsP/CotA-like multicopper oxidase with cupredoxin domain